MAQSNMRGKLADRASILKSGFSELEKAVIKATKHNTKPPKEKHVRRLVLYTSDQGHRSSEIIALLGKRLELPDWIVVLKTLVVFHRLLRDSKASFINELRYRSHLFNLRRFLDASSPGAHTQSLFIRKYSQYLEEKIIVYKIVGVEFEKERDYTKNLPVDELFEKIPRLQSQLNALLNCRATKEHINNNIIANAFTMLLKDSFKIYSALNDAIIAILEHYFNMTKENATKAFEIYKLFTRETDGMNQMIDLSKRFSRAELPELKHAPTTLVDALENYLKELDEGKNPNPNAGKFEKTEMLQTQKEMRKQMDEFKFDSGEEDDAEDALFPDDAFAAELEPKSQPSISSFDPFGTEPFEPFPVMASPNSGSSKPNAPEAAFDPFSSIPSTGSNSSVANRASYGDKKKQIELLMATSSPVMSSNTPLQPTTVTAPKSSNPWATGNTQPFGQFAPSQPMPQTQSVPYNPFLQTTAPQTQQSFNPFG